MLPVMVTQPVGKTDGMVVTTLPVVTAKPVVPTLPVVQIHVPLLPGAADIAAVPPATAVAHISALYGNGSPENTGGLRSCMRRSGGAFLRATCWTANGTPCWGTGIFWNCTGCSGH